MTRFLPRRSDERGQSLVEFALTIPLVILLMIGLFDLGRIVFINNSLSDGAKHGARHAVIDPRGTDYCARVDDAVRTATRGQPLVRYQVVYESIDQAGGVFGTYQLCEDGGNGDDFGGLGLEVSPGDRVTIELGADVGLITPFVAAATGRSNFNLDARATMVVTFVP